MKIKLITSFVVLLCFLSTKAQQSFIPLPDSLGKHLCEMLINHADIATSPACPTVEKYVEICKKYELPYLQKQLKEADKGQKAYLKEQILNFDEGKRQAYNWIPVSWKNLVNTTAKLDINPQTSSYGKTYFSQSKINEEDSEMELYITINHPDDTYAFKVKTLCIDNQLVIMDVGFGFYHLPFSDENRIRFEELSYNGGIDTTESEIIQGNEPIAIVAEDGSETILNSSKDSVSYNENYRSSVNLYPVTTISSPADFNKKILNLLTEKADFGSDEIFMSKKEFLDVYGKHITDMMKQILKENQDLSDNDRIKIKEIINDPTLLFEEELKNSWGELINNLENEYTLKGLTPYKTEYTISNWTEKFMGYNNDILLRSEMAFKQKDNQSGITFLGACYNGMWKLVYIQSSTYGISEAVAEPVN